MGIWWERHGPSIVETIIAGIFTAIVLVGVVALLAFMHKHECQDFGERVGITVEWNWECLLELPDGRMVSKDDWIFIMVGGEW